MINGSCPKCQSTNIAGPHKVHDHGQGGYHVKIDLPGSYTATLETFTCLVCGFTEFYADNIGLNNIKRDGRILSQNPFANRVKNIPDSIEYCFACGKPVKRTDNICPSCETKLK